VIPVCVAAPLITYLLNSYSTTLLLGYKFGFEILILNGLLTFLGLFAISYYSEDYPDMSLRRTRVDGEK